jgi:hypothetical protein
MLSTTRDPLLAMKIFTSNQSINLIKSLFFVFPFAFFLLSRYQLLSCRFFALIQSIMISSHIPAFVLLSHCWCPLEIPGQWYLSPPPFFLVICASYSCSRIVCLFVCFWTLMLSRRAPPRGEYGEYSRNAVYWNIRTLHLRLTHTL